MPRAFAHNELDARTLKKVAAERRLLEKFENEHAVTTKLPSCQGVMVILDSICLGASYSAGVWTLASQTAKLYQRQRAGTERSSRYTSNTINTKTLITAKDRNAGTQSVRVFNASLLPVISAAPVFAVQDVYGDLYLVNPRQQLIVTPNSSQAKGSTPVTCTIDGLATTISCVPRGADVVSGKLCLAWEDPTGTKLYVGPWEC